MRPLWLLDSEAALLAAMHTHVLLMNDSHQHRWVQQGHGGPEGLEVPEAHKMHVESWCTWIFMMITSNTDDLLELMMHISDTHQRSNVSCLALLTRRPWQTLQDRGERCSKDQTKQSYVTKSHLKCRWNSCRYEPCLNGLRIIILPAVQWVLGLLGILWFLHLL